METESRQSNPDWTWEEELLAFATYIRYQTQGDSNHPAVHQLSELLRSLPIHNASVRAPTFRNRNSVARKLADIHTHQPGFPGKATSGSRLDREIWLQFGNQIPEALRIADLIQSEATHFHASAPDLEASSETFPEGRILYSVHKRRERSPSLRKRKLKQFRRQHGRLFCEACQLDVALMTGNENLDVYECHHLKPLHEIGETESGLSDLVILCPTCHRIAHKLRPWPDLEGLKSLCTIRKVNSSQKNA